MSDSDDIKFDADSKLSYLHQFHQISIVLLTFYEIRWQFSHSSLSANQAQKEGFPLNMNTIAVNMLRIPEFRAG